MITSARVSVRALSRFFEYALAISAWKQAGGVRWALRSNPSSGNVHPTEGYLLIDEMPGLSLLSTGKTISLPQSLAPDAVRELTQYIWHGKANRRSRDDPAMVGSLRQAMHQQFDWTSPPEALSRILA